MINPTRGLKEGDPLSPFFYIYIFLFFMFAKGLSTIINRAEEESLIKSLPITRQGTMLTHLFFCRR
jgi:hypothetical protein